MSLSVSMSGIQMWLEHGKLWVHIFPWRVQSNDARDKKTERHKDCSVKRLTAPQAHSVIQFSGAGWPNAEWANLSMCCLLTKLAAKHAFVPCCMSETEEVIYVLFGYGSLVWRIGSEVREFFRATHWVHLLYQIGYTISHTAVNITGSELRGRTL